MDNASKELEQSGLKGQGTLTRSLIFGRPVSGNTIAVLETLDGWGYITTAVSFLILGMVVFAHAWFIFATTVGKTVLSQRGSRKFGQRAKW